MDNGYSGEIDHNGVDHKKSPKRVRRNPKKNSSVKHSFRSEFKPKKRIRTSSGSGTQKPLLPLPWDLRKKSFIENKNKVSVNREKVARKLGSIEIQSFGNEALLLQEALNAHAESSGPLQLTRRFHAYPQRLNPSIPQILLRQENKNALLFDPFMGSGTVLLEGLLQGIRVSGNDLNPLAKLITRERCRWLSLRNASRVWTEVEELRGFIESEKLGLHKVFHPHAKWLQSRYPPHLLVEMLHWINCIRQLRDPAIRESLNAVFSSLVYRFTPNVRATPRNSRIPRGSFGRAMSEMTSFLVHGQTDLSKLIRHIESPSLTCSNILKSEKDYSELADLIITRPPVPGTVRFMLGQELLLKWLGIFDKKINSEWLGTSGDCLKKNWTPRFRRMMLNLRRATACGGKCYFLYEDWIEKGSRVDALEFIRKFSQSEGWTLKSAAFRRINPGSHEIKPYEKSGKWEYLILLRN